MSRKHNQYFHIYILVSESDPHMVKVGKANNLKRPAYFRKAGYAGVTDWQQVVTIATGSNEAAFAIESMSKAKLFNQGYLKPKIMWDDLKKPGRRVGATECFNYHIDHTAYYCEREHSVLRYVNTPSLPLVGFSFLP